MSGEGRRSVVREGCEPSLSCDVYCLSVFPKDIHEFVTLCLQIAEESLTMFRNAAELAIVEAWRGKVRYSSVVQEVVRQHNGMKVSSFVR